MWLRSKELFEKAKQVFPGGVNSPARAMKHLPHPFYVSRAEGPYLYTVDGVKLIDYCMGFGPLILGHKPKVVEEVEKEFDLKIHKSVWPGRDKLLPMAQDIIDNLAKGKINKALDITHLMEEACGFPKPNIEVLKAQIPGGMYSNFVNQLARDKKSEYLGRALDAVQEVRQKAGWCPLVTPTSQIVGVKAYFTAMGKTVNPVQYFNLIAGFYGKTPFPISEDYREKVCGFREEKEYDSSGFNLIVLERVI